MGATRFGTLELEAITAYMDLYLATGKPLYLNAVNGAYRMFKEKWQHAGAGSWPSNTRTSHRAAPGSGCRCPRGSPSGLRQGRLNFLFLASRGRPVKNRNPQPARQIRRSGVSPAPVDVSHDPAPAGGARPAAADHASIPADKKGREVATRGPPADCYVHCTFTTPCG